MEVLLPQAGALAWFARGVGRHEATQRIAGQPHTLGT